MSQMFLKITGKQNNHQFDLPNFLKYCDNISHKLLRLSQSLEKILEILEWKFYHFKEINQHSLLPPTQLPVHTTQRVECVGRKQQH